MTDLNANSGLPRGLGTWLGMGNRAYKLMVAIGSLITTIVLTLGKLIIGVLSGFLALVADRMSASTGSLMDLPHARASYRFPPDVR